MSKGIGIYANGLSGSVLFRFTPEVIRRIRAGELTWKIWLAEHLPGVEDGFKETLVKEGMPKDAAEAFFHE